jgi:hypothetical protein
LRPGLILIPDLKSAKDKKTGRRKATGFFDGAPGRAHQ